MKTILFLFFALLASVPAGAQLNAYLGYIHNPGCDNQSGKLSVQAVGGMGNYTYLWSNGSTTDTAYNLGAGFHSVTVYSGPDSVVETIFLDPFGIENVLVQHACSGDPGSIYLDNITAAYPLQFHWYQNGVLMSENSAFNENLTPDTYQYAVIDNDGCVDSGSVVISASSPQAEVFLSDSSLCWGASAQVWFTPGFTMEDGWGNMFSTTVDTFTYMNVPGSSGIPQVWMDSLGCYTDYIPFPFVYLQPHPDPMMLYQIGDTVSLSFVPNQAADPVNTYTWYRNGVFITENAYSYLVVNTGGMYAVTRTNQYDCTNYGSLNVAFAGLDQNNIGGIRLYPNPAVGGQTWQVEIADFSRKLEYTLFDSNGRKITSGDLVTSVNSIVVPDNAGVYFLEVENRRFKLVSIH
ncbi:MAG TPA: T9SS type A sorting domain-containing protein [Fluviicola sp.]|nr:T9SS type A sorting domain-containing protein [Fluviicola sp.]